MKLSKLSTAILVALISNQVHAVTSLDQIIVTANKIEQTLKQITNNVHVITAEEIEAKHYRSISEALNEVTGMSIIRNGGLGTTTSVFIRGSASNRVLILIDGIRTNDPSNISGSDLTNISMSNIERIEIIKGAQSGVWGSDAAAGVINIITKGNKGTQILVENGSYQTQKLELSTGTKIDNLTLSLSIQRVETNSFSAQSPAGTDIDDYEYDPYKNTNLAGKIKYNINNHSFLSLIHNYTGSDANYDEFNSPDSIKRSTSKTNLTSLEYQVSDTNIILQQSLFHTKQLDEDYTDRVIGDTQSAQITQNIGAFLIGGAYTTNKTNVEKPSYNYLPPTYSKTYLEQFTETKKNYANSLFATYHHQLGNFTFNEALRWDSYSNFNAKVTGKLGAKYAPTETDYIAFNYGTAYNAPSLMHIINPWGIGNSNLNPETSEAFSVDFKTSGLKIGIFDKQIGHLISWQDGQYQNISGISKIRGYEVEYSISFDQVDLSANYTRLIMAEKSDGTALAGSPETQAGLNINWYANNNLDLTLNGQYIGERSEDSNTQFYSVWNSSVNYKINKRVSGYLRVENLFDTYYQLVDGYSAAERSVYFGIKANL